MKFEQSARTLQELVFLQVGIWLKNGRSLADSQFAEKRKKGTKVVKVASKCTYPAGVAFW